VKDAAPDMALSPATPEIGFIHRKFSRANLYFVANTSNESKHVRAQFRDTAKYAEMWDGFSGDSSGIPDPRNIELDLAPYESRIIFFSDSATVPLQHAQPPQRQTVLADLSQQWRVKLDGLGISIDMDHLASWSDNPKTKYYSGLATYQKTFNLTPAYQRKGTRILLDFGNGTRQPLPSPPGEHNMKAYIEPPVREAAQIYVNGKLAGVVWRPPFRIDITTYIREGTNELRVIVGNTAINALAGQPLPDYRLLRARYGILFVPQDMDNLHPLPSGILGPVTLGESSPSNANAEGPTP